MISITRQSKSFLSSGRQNATKHKVSVISHSTESVRPTPQQAAIIKRFPAMIRECDELLKSPLSETDGANLTLIVTELRKALNPE